MQIPKRFKLLGQTIEVVENPSLGVTDDARGMAHYRMSKIEIQPNGENNPFPDSHIGHTFCHELTHFLFHLAGYPEDRSDEIKVDRIAGLLHQALTTMEYK